MSPIPKAVLYYSRSSIWSAVVLLTLEEKGYGSDEVDLKPVDLARGENYDPSFLRINPKATVPALVVPLQKTLSEDVESRYKAITSTKDIVEFLDKSRSARSATHTTSTAPALTLAPATVSFAAITSSIINLLHSEAADPNRLFYFSARDDESLRARAPVLLHYARGKQQALETYLSRAQSGEITVSEKVKALWAERKAAADALVQVLTDAEKSAGELDAAGQKKRDEYFQISRGSWEGAVKDALNALESEIVGPLVLGDQLSIADVHLEAWLTRALAIAGATAADSGEVAVKRLQEYTGAEGHYGKLVGYWERIKERSSWKKVYGNGLF
ncbi:hypothetical protein AX16_009599 [Volvariella volvacea WC 439]|nr:hypothetical protein AX16_009599 [Volvariella volvacea WC 439]